VAPLGLDQVDALSSQLVRARVWAGAVVSAGTVVAATVGAAVVSGVSSLPQAVSAMTSTRITAKMVIFFIFGSSLIQRKGNICTIWLYYKPEGKNLQCCLQ
jgi:hypothetical protein